MHDKVNDEETKNDVNEELGEYFDLDSLNLENWKSTCKIVKIIVYYMCYLILVWCSPHYTRFKLIKKKGDYYGFK